MNSIKIFGYYLFAAPLLVITFISGSLFLSYPPASNDDLKKHSIQTDSLSKNELEETIRLATDKFKDPKNAQAAGYRSLGPDMPNMGVHWINTGIAVQRSIDFERPSTLTYLPVNGALQLTGVAYTSPVKTGETAPVLPIESMTWHYHSGSLEKEAHGIHAEHMQRAQTAEMNLAMLHAWVWSDNPDGIFSADNWALSYYRFGLKPPKSEELDPDVSKALFLASGKVDYYLKFIELSIEPETLDEDTIRPVLSEYSLKVNDVLKSYEPGNSISANHREEISELWLDMWQQIKQILAPKKWDKIEIQLKNHKH